MNSILRTTAVTAVLSTLILITGCQYPGKVVSTQTSDVCPQCEMQTVTSPIKGLTYTKHVCPNCKTVVKQTVMNTGHASIVTAFLNEHLDKQRQRAEIESMDKRNLFKDPKKKPI